MTLPAPAGAPTGLDALAEPQVPVSRGWVSRLTIASIGLYAGFFGPLQVLLALQIADFAPTHKESVLALVTGVGALMSTVGTPLWGALSDRTGSRFGRRLPWIAGGALAGALALLVLSAASSVAMVVVGWAAVQLCLNGVVAALTACVPDQVPEQQRGFVSGWVGLAQTMGVVVGTGVATAAGGIRAGYAALAALVIVTVSLFLVRSGDRPLRDDQRGPLALGAFVRGFWVSPRAHPDFAWAWGTRFLMNVANAIGTLYLLYFLTDVVRVDDPEGHVFILVLIYAGALCLTAVVSGIASDRLGKRKIFVIVAGVVMTAACLFLAFRPTWPGAVGAAVLLGLGFGVYAAVDFALITEVLPAAADRARDLGVINIANALPQVLAPVIAAPVLALFATRATGYRALYVVAAVVGLVGALLVRRIRSVS